MPTLPQQLTLMTDHRFLNRYGPRVFLDTRDLIRLLEKEEPLSPSALAKELAARQARIVLLPSNVMELVPYKEGAPFSVDRALDLMHRLEQLPHAFLRSPDLAWNECRAALAAFSGERTLPSIDPYVEHWWATMWKIPPTIAASVMPNEVRYLNSLTLAEQISHLLLEPEDIRFSTTQRDEARESMRQDREKFGTRRGTTTAFNGALARLVSWTGRPEPSGGIDAFASYITENPSALKGWRTGFAVWEEYRCNLTAIPTIGDFPDFSHVQALPYVTHATLDRAWQARCRQAAARLKKSGDPTAKWYQRVFNDLESILKSW